MTDEIAVPAEVAELAEKEALTIDELLKAYYNHFDADFE